LIFNLGNSGDLAILAISSGPCLRGEISICSNYQQMQNCCPVGLQLGGQKIAVPSLGDNAAGCTQITRIMAMQKLSFMVRIAVLFFDMGFILSCSAWSNMSKNAHPRLRSTEISSC
jgi:hypothetical protein